MRMSGEDMANSSCMAVPSDSTPFTEDAWELPPGSLLASLLPGVGSDPFNFRREVGMCRVLAVSVHLG